MWYKLSLLPDHKDTKLVYLCKVSPELLLETRLPNNVTSSFSKPDIVTRHLPLTYRASTYSDMQ